MLGLLSYKSLGQMQQSRELLQQSLAAMPLRSPVRIYVEKSVAYLENMRSFTAAAKVSRPIAWIWCDAQRRVVERCDAPRRAALPTVMSISPTPLID